jgi:peroxisome-assembly ATPase
MVGRPPTQHLSLSITNPLILYRAQVATKRIRPDPAQHRLALQLQKLYFRLKDYAPEVEYRYRLEKIGRAVARSQPSSSGDGAQQRDSVRAEDENGPVNGEPKIGVLSSLLSFNSFAASTLALTRTTPLHDSALSINSPMGMLLYGEVGRGKSMLLDLLYSSLPSRKKRRWHFNTFMLDIFRRIEIARIERLEGSGLGAATRTSLFGGQSVSDHENVILTLAKDTVSDSPILFLDEFQMPDRTSSKLVNTFFTAFFHLGGVLVASSNRMPEELSKAAGIEFGEFQRRRGAASGGFFGLGWGLSRTSEGEKAAKTDFGMFLELLKARCEVWELEGERDWRREGDEIAAVPVSEADDGLLAEELSFTSETRGSLAAVAALAESSIPSSSDSPAHYHINILSPPGTSSIEDKINLLNPQNIWQATTLRIYARNLHLPTTYKGILKSSFNDLCASYLGPADYVSLCSTFHTLILTDVPVLTLSQKNEARRFITLLDALYEAKCRLLIQADAPPDKLFFPETRIRSGITRTTTDGNGVDQPTLEESSDSITSEAFSEIYQDSTAPFRPNISTYTEQNIQSSIPPSFTPSLSNPNLRTVLADEDADFGPTYGNGRGHGISNSSHTTDAVPGPDFTSTTALTGEDERFAYKRARSRLWEMCGRKWWDERRVAPDAAAEEEKSPEWWMPIGRDGRFWESAAVKDSAPGLDRSSPAGDSRVVSGTTDSNGETVVRSDPKRDAMFRHGASPFRSAADPPPKFGWQHAWGMMRWGKKAGEWGKGVDGKRPGRREEEADAATEEGRKQ